jgi:hypothetical protein
VLYQLLFLGFMLLTFPATAGAKTCKEFRTCEEAKQAFKAGDKKLDRDNDGIPCENLCMDPTSKGNAK